MPTKKRPPAVRLSLKCSCGGSLYGGVSPAVAATKIHDIFIRTHAGDGHKIMDKSKICDQTVFLRQRSDEATEES